VQVEEAPPPVTIDPSKAVPLPQSDSHVEIRAKGLGGSRQPQALQYSAPTIDGAAGAGGVVMESSAPALGIGADTGTPAKTPAGRGSTGRGSTGRRPTPAGQATGGGPSRNAPCYCGSGRKYKRCHGAPGAA
jgi:preprotein translocase subunit SecA